MAQDIDVLLSHVSNSKDFKTVKAYEIFRDEEIPDGLPQTNMEYDFAKRKILDGRTRREEVDINTQGFHFLYHKFGRSLSADDIRGDEGAALMDTFLQEVEEVMKKDMGAEKICIYDWRLRSNGRPIHDSSPPDAQRALLLPPAKHAHGDESRNCGYRVVCQHLTDTERTELDEGKWHIRLVNLWKPLVKVVEDRPLAVCDWTTVQSEDWELADQVFDQRVDEALFLIAKDRHQWYWLSRQTEDEATVFTVWDSIKYSHGVEASVAHAAFHHPTAVAETPRESIELRTIVWNKL